jgi:hypothetical protein
MDPQTIHFLEINNGNFLVILSEVYYTGGTPWKDRLWTVGLHFKKGRFRTSTVFSIFCFRNIKYQSIPVKQAYLLNKNLEH